MSQPTPLFAGRVEQGKVQLAEPQAWRSLLRQYEGREIELRVTRKRKTRSTSQNSYYWGCVIPLLAEYCGYEAEEMHSALKMRFLQRHCFAHDNVALPTVRSTTDLNTAEFTEYVEQCRRLGAEMGVVIPDPGAVE